MSEQKQALERIASELGMLADTPPMNIAYEVIFRLQGARTWGEQKRLAQCSGLSVGFVNTLMRGKRNASPKVARKLEQATGIAKELWVFGTAEERREAVHAWWLKRCAQPKEAQP